MGRYLYFVSGELKIKEGRRIIARPFQGAMAFAPARSVEDYARLEAELSQYLYEKHPSAIPDSATINCLALLSPEPLSEGV